MDPLKNCISSQISIDDRSLERIRTNFHTQKLNKGEYFLHAGELCRKMAFIESGFLRLYEVVAGKEVTFWIGSEGSFITSLSSFVFQSASYWNIQAITDCKLQVISRDDHFKLSREERKWLEFDNSLLASSFAKLEKKMFAHLHTTSNQRFESLMEDHPELFQQVPLQYIASMLGITPESLSRLRKNLAKPIS